MAKYIVFLCVNILLSALILSIAFRGNYVWYALGFIRKSGLSIDMNKLFPKVLIHLWENLLKYPKELDKTHLSKEDKLVFHLIWSVLIPFLCVAGSVREPYLMKTFMFVFFCSIIAKKVLLLSFKKQRVMVFNKNAYRLYKFLHNQLSAGVQPKESMASLYRIVHEPFLRERLKALGSMYAQTLDFEIAFDEIAGYYGGSDVEAFKIAIKQGLDMGDNLNTIKKQEALMFSKYMNYLQLETNRQKIKTLVVVSIFCFIIIFMIGLPLMIELNQAIDLIFI